MSWVVQCPKHGVVVEEYHFEALHSLEFHSKKTCSLKKERTFLFEQIEWIICEIKEGLLDSKKIRKQLDRIM